MYDSSSYVLSIVLAKVIHELTLTMTLRMTHDDDDLDLKIDYDDYEE